MWFEIISLLFGSGGVLYGAIIWFFSRRKRNNDFLSELQKSINNLSTSYTDTLDKLVDVQRQNSQLMINQHSLELLNKELLENQAALKSEIELLRGENKGLIKKLNELNKLLKNETCALNNSGDSSD